MVTTGIIFFLSSLLIVFTSFFRLYKYRDCRYLTVLSVIYSVFCFMAFGKIAGFIAAQSIESIVTQYGYDASRLPVSVSGLIKCGLIGGCTFNLFTAIWIWLRGGFWKYCLISVVLFCIVGLAAAPVVGISPIYSLFGMCCGFMASVAWVLGLTYVEFCVIGNIYVPALAVILTAIYMVYNCRTAYNIIVKDLVTLSGISQMAAVILLLWHYWGSYDYAFYQCVKDLRGLADRYHTTYEAVNIVIYVLIIPAFLAVDIIIGRSFRIKK